MNTRTLCLDFLILASAAYPSGVSYSLFTALHRGAAHRMSTTFLAFLCLPYMVLVIAVWLLRPTFFSFQPTSWTLLGIAAICAPVALLVEYAVQLIASYRQRGLNLRTITLPSFWRVRLTYTDYLLLGAIVIGEELFYRQIWLGGLQTAFSWPLLWAVAVSSLVYGLNHLAFGRLAVLSKTITGAIYASLYVLGGSVWLPIVTHGLQNALLFSMSREKNA